MNAAIINDINYCVLCKVQQLVVNANIADAPKPLTSTPTYFRKATFLGLKALNGTANANTVSLGPDSAAGKQPIVFSAGDERSFEAPVGSKWNLQDWCFKVTADGDGLVVMYS